MTDQTELSFLLREPFEEPAAETTQNLPRKNRTSRLRARPSRKLTVIVVVAVLVLASAGGVWAASGSSAATYRWATATKADVDETLNSYGTVKPLNEAVVAFPVSGTIATVPVKVGQQVVNGQTLATIELSSLQAKLDSAKSTLATAQAKLVSDTQAQADGTTVSNSNATSGSLGPADIGKATPVTGHGSGGTGSGSGASADTSAAQAAVTQAQAKLLADQQAVDGLLGSVAADLRNGTSTCGSLITSLQNLKPATTPSTTPTPGTQTPAGGGASVVPDTSACTALLNKVLADQQSVTTAQNTVSADETALTAAVAKLVAAAQSGTTPTPTPTPTPSTTPSTGSRSGSSRTGSSGSSSSFSGSTSTGSSRAGTGGGGGGTLVTAQQLVLDQATVDADTAGVTVAEQSLKQAALVSPLAGTVAQINVKPGSSVSAQSAAVTVIGAGVDQVTTTVGDLDLQKVHLGADATVVPDGVDKPIHGTVTAIGLLPVSTSSTNSAASGSSRSTSASTSTGSTSTTSTATNSATYPVTISLDSGGLYSGSGADVSITVKKTSGVVTVPTSAVTSLGTLHTVTLSSGGKVVRKLVVVGATDATLTQITSGLNVGDHVALAKMNDPVPTSGTTSITNRRGTLGGGGLTGGSLTGGGTGGRTGGFTRGAATTRGGG